MIRFSDVVNNYKAVFLDSYGVLKNHRGVIEGVNEVIQHVRARDMAMRVLTNDASRSHVEQAEVFHLLGIDEIRPEEIITSGMMARQFLALKKPAGLVAYLGTHDAARFIEKAGLRCLAVKDISEEQISQVEAMVFLDDEGFDWNTDINGTLNLLRQRNITTIVANSDSIYPVSKNNVSIATGGIAKLVELVLGREFIHFGKPDSQMFMYAFEDINREGAYTRQDVLMVGDTLHTDILGGNKFGLATCLVLSGNTRPDNVETKIKASGIIPDFICQSIAD